MKSTEKEISYSITNSYSTLNKRSAKTKNIWFACHGIGYLSRYFIRHFSGLTADENYIIAPQASSKYYLNGAYKHVGASWLTRENTQKEISNVMHNLNAIYEAESIPKDINFYVLGFSQGVSVVMRWLAKYKIPCDKLIIYAGSIPSELTAQDFEFIDYNTTEIVNTVGTEDEYFTPERMALEKQKMDVLFGNNYKIITFKGKHEVQSNVLKDFL